MRTRIAVMAACTACYDAKQQAASSRCTAAGSSSSAHGCGLGVLRNHATVTGQHPMGCLPVMERFKTFQTNMKQTWLKHAETHGDSSPKNEHVYTQETNRSAAAKLQACKKDCVHFG
jgi:hypothetical protein